MISPEKYISYFDVYADSAVLHPHLLTFLHQEVEFLQRLDLVPPCLQLLILPPRDGDVRTRAEGLLKIIRGIFHNK